MTAVVVCAALSAAGLAIALLTAWKRRFRRATVIAAWALLPLGFQLTGMIEMFGKIGKAVGKWAKDLAFDPTVWTGFGVLAVAVVLFVIARFTSGKAGARKERRTKKKAKNSERGVTGTPGGPALPAANTPAGAQAGERRTPQPAATSNKRGGDDGLGDFSEIEDILKRRGI
jgi:hypothetical protein